MNNPFEKEASAVLDILKVAYDQIKAINFHQDAIWLKQKAMMDIKRNISSLSIQLGIEIDVDGDDVIGAPREDHSKPIVKIMGRVIGEDKATAQLPSITNSEAISEIETGERAKELYARFTGLTVEDILNTIPVKDIYAVADIAGVDYDVIPEVATAEFIESIIKAIQESGIDKTEVNTGDTAATTTSANPELDELKRKRDELYKIFAETETDQLIDKYPDIEVRAVAKKAGLPVTETNPAKISVKFINQIKDAIKKQKELDA